VPVAVEWDDYVAAGYWIARPVHRPSWCDERFVADPIVSCSACLLGGGAGPEVAWSSGFDESALDLGVASADLADARRWVENHGPLVDFLGTWTSPAPLLDFASRFIAEGTVTVLGVALPTERARRYGKDPSDAMEQMLSNCQALAPGGMPLGWEPVEWLEQGVTCSWTCNGLQPKVAEQFDLELTSDGLLPSQTHADAVMEIIDPLPKESGPWEAFLLVRYGPEPHGPFRELPPPSCPTPSK